MIKKNLARKVGNADKVDEDNNPDGTKNDDRSTGVRDKKKIFHKQRKNLSNPYKLKQLVTTRAQLQN